MKKIPKIVGKQSLCSELKCEVSHKFILHTIRGYIFKQYIQAYKTKLILKVHTVCVYIYIYIYILSKNIYIFLKKIYI